MTAAAPRETPSWPTSESFVSALSAMASSPRLGLHRPGARDRLTGGGRRLLGRHLGALERRLQVECDDVVRFRARDEVHQREPPAALQGADEVGDRREPAAL